jgi:hypothetical protein
VLCERHRLVPPEERLRCVSGAALTRFQETGQRGDWHAYATARVDLDSALDAIHRLRRLRLGANPAAKRAFVDGDDRPQARRPRWW